MLILLVLEEAEELSCELLCLVVVCGPHAVCPCVRRSGEVESVAGVGGGGNPDFPWF